MKFLCGAARECVTPVIGTKLYGYRPDVISDSIHDDLYVSAIAFGNGEKTLVLISIDCGDLHNELDAELRAASALECGISPSDIILATTHTHCAPNLSGVEGWGEIDLEYYNNILRPALVRAAREAVLGMAEAELGVESGRSEVGINRRQQDRHGNITLGQNPWGSYDPEMTVIRIRRCDDKKGIVNLIHYGCHGTACGCSTVITRDWIGGMLDGMEKETGVLSVFINGAIGDVGPRITNGQTTGDITYVEALGHVAASDAVRLSNTVSTYFTPKIESHVGIVGLPYEEPVALDEVRRELATIKNPEMLINCDRLRYEHLRALEEWHMAGGKDIPSEFNFELTVFVIGDIAIIPYPYEIFSEISLRMRAYSGFRHTLCLSCTNGYNAYLPTQDQLCRGGYEVAVFKYANLFPLAPNTDDNLIKETLRIMKK